MNEKAISLLSVSQEAVSTIDISEEFSLPDYVPEVRRVLCVMADALPESKYLQGNMLELGGSVTYSLIYTDDEGNLNALPLNSSYETKLALPQNAHLTLVDAQVDSTTYKVTAPRKLTLKSRLKCRVTPICKEQIEEEISSKSSADEIYLERKPKTVNSMSLCVAEQPNVRLSDKLELDDGKEAKPIWCDANIIIKEARAESRRVSVRGEAVVKCLVESEGEVKVITKALPIAEEIEVEHLGDNQVARVVGRCVSLSISNEEADNSTQLFFDLVCELECQTMENKQIILLEDVYSTKNEMDVTYKKTPIYSLVKAGGSSFTLNEGIKRRGKEISSIIDTLVAPTCEKTEIKNGKMIATGKLLVNVLGISEAGEGEGIEYLCETYELPLKYELELGGQISNGISKCTFSTLGASARLDKDMIYINCEIYPSYLVFNRADEEIVDRASIKRDKEIKKDQSCARVYFPKEDDTLWKIAKKYYTTVNKLTELNEIDNQSSSLPKSIIV
ncbi:MAG: LysM peptidoglycan-binding domain-containing protein [Clostridia bacterium]|nr:LysM peptidoglycan-binding domain-containing protein [Clostridia bacterium]